MAEVSLLGSTFTTTAGAKSVTATPAVGDLIIIFVQVSGDTTWSSPTDDNSSGTYSLIGVSLDDSSGRYGAVYVRESRIASGASTVFSLANPGTDTGGGLAVVKVTGMSRAGSSAVRQYKQDVQTTITVGFPATGSWTSARLTGNPTIGFLLVPYATPGVDPTSSFTELLETGYGSPNTGIEIQSRNSGDTGSTLTWGTEINSSWSVMGVELDASNTSNMFLMF